MTVLVLTRGLPASGKTTWAREWVREDPANRVRLNRDDFRRMLFGLDAGDLTSVQEDAVTAAQHGAIAGALRSGRSVVADDTNLRAKNVRTLVDVARRAGAGHEVVEFDVPVDECMRRDAFRAGAGDRQVGHEVIAQFAQRFYAKGKLKPLHLTEVASENAAPARYVPDESLPAAWIFDIDGTLAHMEGRGPFEWHRVGEDSVDDIVADVAAQLGRDYEIVVVSGRDGSCRAETELWLSDNGIPHQNLHMRPAGDMRKDSVVKREIFWREIAPEYNVRGVFDDRDQVVEMWRSVGLKCFQVAPGNF